MRSFPRLIVLLCGIALLALTAGLIWRQSWAVNLLPWELSRLSAIFLGSITIAYGVPLVWIALAEERRALAGLAIGLAVTFGGMAALVVPRAWGDSPKPVAASFAIATLVLMVASILVYFWSRRAAFRETRTIPRSARVPMTIIPLIVITVGCALALNVPNIFPWRLSPELSFMYGWIFLGAAAYFLYAFAHPSWANGYGQLMGFLAYALVLFGPFISHFNTVPAEWHLNLIVYLGVLTFGTVVACYFLFVSRSSRLRLNVGRNHDHPVL